MSAPANLSISFSLPHSPRALDFHLNDKAWWLGGFRSVAKPLRVAHKNLHKCLLLPGGRLLRLHHGPVSNRIEQLRGRHFMWKFIFISSIDICQFSITSLFNSVDDRHRSISFRSVILIMIYAGTIILNLLAASVDNKFPVASNQSAENSTMPSVMEPAERDNSVLVAPAFCFANDKIYSLPLLLASGQRWDGLLVEHSIHCPELWRNHRMAYGVLDEYRLAVRNTVRDGQISRAPLSISNTFQCT